MQHEQFMDLALGLCEEALRRGDWPVGVVLVRDGQVIGTGQNRQNTRHDPTLHAEVDAISSAHAKRTDLRGATIYLPMEPCPMCAWALRLSGVDRLVIGLRHADLHRLDLGTYTIEGLAKMLGYNVDVLSGVRKDECLAIRRRWGQDRTRHIT